MIKKDFYFLAIIALVLVLLSLPALVAPESVFFNFGDIYAYHYPLQHLTAAGLQEGRLPFWNPYVFSGLPLLANSQAAVFYPLAILFRVFPLTYAFTLYSVLHLFIAALGMHLWMRSSLKLGPAAAAFFAAAYCLCPYLIYRIAQGIPTHISALAYVPWCWLALCSRRTGFLSGVLALQFFSGHPQFAVINGIGMGMYVLGTRVLSRSDAWRTLAREGLIAAVLCLVQLVPTVEFLSASNRSGIPESFKMAYSMPFSSFATMLHPSFFGDPLRGTFSSVPSVFFEMYALYVGVIPLLLAVYAFLIVFRREKGAGAVCGAWLLALIGGMLALGSYNPLMGWLSQVPIVGLSRVPARFGLLVIWGVLWAGALGWKRFNKNHSIGRAWKTVAWLILIADLGFWGARFIFTQDPSPYLRPNAVMRDQLAGKAVRFATDPALSNPNKAMLYRAMNVNGYDAYYLDSYTRYAARSEGGPAGDPSRTYIRNVNSPEMQRLGVKYFLSPEKLKWKNIEVSDKTFLYTTPAALPLAFWEEAVGRFPNAKGLDVSVTTPERWSVRGISSGKQRLILGLAGYPGWRAYINGMRKEIFEYGALMPAVSVGPGPVSVDFIFIPTGWVVLSCAAAFAWCAWLFDFSRRVLA